MGMLAYNPDKDIFRKGFGKRFLNAMVARGRMARGETLGSGEGQNYRSE